MTNRRKVMVLKCLNSFGMSSPSPSLDNTPLASTHMPSVEKQPYWIGQTQKCPSCSKIIPANVMSIHVAMCSPPVLENNAAAGPINNLKTVPEFSIDERIIQLNKFEVLMLTPIQMKEFNELFVQKDVVHAEPLFNSWLHLKMSTIPTESESIKRILTAHTYSNVPNRK